MLYIQNIERQYIQTHTRIHAHCNIYTTPHTYTHMLARAKIAIRQIRGIPSITRQQEMVDMETFQSMCVYVCMRACVRMCVCVSCQCIMTPVLLLLLLI